MSGKTYCEQEDRFTETEQKKVIGWVNWLLNPNDVGIAADKMGMDHKSFCVKFTNDPILAKHFLTCVFLLTEELYAQKS